MSKKCKCPPAGAPEWMMTFGDMMSLLLTFFIMLVSMSEIKKEDKFLADVEQVKEGFGIHGGGSHSTSRDPPNQSMREKLQKMEKGKLPKLSHSNDEGTQGRYDNVTVVREGMRYIVGSRITFDPGSADLNEEAKPLLAQIAKQVRGLKNKLEIRGHAASAEAMIRTPYADLQDLSFARAKAVAAYLISPEVGVDPERIRLVAAGDSEPLTVRQYTDSALEANRRVEVVQMEAVVGEFQKPQTGQTPKP